MGLKIRIAAGAVIVQAELNDGPTAARVAEALPIRAVAQRWGQEIYFAIPVDADRESDAREVVEAGELGYWPDGNAFCMFFGPTPASRDQEIRAASPVNIIGMMQGDLSQLSDVPTGAEVVIETV